MPAMYAIAIVRYRQPVEEVLKVQEQHRAYLGQLKARRIVPDRNPKVSGSTTTRIYACDPHEAWLVSRVTVMTNPGRSWYLPAY